MNKDNPDRVSEPGSTRVRDCLYHLVVYLFVLAIIFVVSGASGAFVWIALFWGFAVVLHAIYAVFG